MLWHEQTWPAIQAVDKEKVVLVPLGSLEQHGHHLPLFVDTMQVQAVADDVHRTMSDRILLLQLGRPAMDNGLPLTYVADAELRAAIAAIQQER